MKGRKISFFILILVALSALIGILKINNDTQRLAILTT